MARVPQASANFVLYNTRNKTKNKNSLWVNEKSAEVISKNTHICNIETG
jgi:hypothetical protein